MLISFSLRNAFSFADEQTLDMRANKKIRAHGYSIITHERNGNVPEGWELLPVMSVYGANASGKSNLLRSLGFVMEAIASGGQDTIAPHLLGRFITENYPMIESPSFVLEFLIHRDKYRLCIESGSRSIVSEQLSCQIGAKGKEKIIYRREWNPEAKAWHMQIGTSRDIEDALKEEIKYVGSMEKGNKQLLLHALCNRGQHRLFRAVADWAFRYGTAPQARALGMETGYFHAAADSPYFDLAEHPERKKRVLAFLREMNPHIIDYHFAENKNIPGTLGKRHRLIFQYSRETRIPENDEQVDVLLTANESRGIYTAFALLPAILSALEHGGLVAVDELENSLHPLLMKKVVSMFTDPDVNTGGGQLIFTTHNALIMDKRNLRQDEIGFVEKDEEGRSEFYKLSEIEGVRSDLDFCRNYILGAFGAIPKLE